MTGRVSSKPSCLQAACGTIARAQTHGSRFTLAPAWPGYGYAGSGSHQRLFVLLISDVRLVYLVLCCGMSTPIRNKAKKQPSPSRVLIRPAGRVRKVLTYHGSGLVGKGRKVSSRVTLTRPDPTRP